MAKKRANGEGNIRKRADGRWEGRYTAGYHPETGKRIIKNVLGKTQAELSFYARVLSKELPAQTLFTFFELRKQRAVLFELFALLGHDLFAVSYTHLKRNCLQVWGTVTGGAYHSARKVSMCVRNNQKSVLA